MKKIRSIILGVSLVLSAAFLYFIYPKINSLFPELPKQTITQSCVIFANKTDREIEVIARPYKKSYLKMMLPPATRGFMELADQEGDPLPLKYVTIRYHGRRFKFNDHELLNTCPESGENKIPLKRYFAIMTLDQNSPYWEQMKKRAEDESIELRDQRKYLVVSNFCRLGSPYDSKAKLAMRRIGSF